MLSPGAKNGPNNRYHSYGRSISSSALWLAATAMLLLVIAVPRAGAAETGGETESENGEDDIKLTISYRRAPLERVLDRLSRAAGGLNIKIQVEDPEQQRELERMPVTIELNQVTWRTALDVLASKYRFAINRELVRDGVLLLERPPRVTMNVQNAPIEDVIKLIAADARANIIIGPEVQGNVSFSIHDVPWREALDSILRSHGFIQVQDSSGVVRVTTPDMVETQMEVQVFVLRYISPQRTKYSGVVKSDYIVKETSSVSEEFGLLNVLNGIKSDNGSITYEPRTNQIVVKDTRTKIQEMESVIRQMDSAPYQVMINTRILEARQGSEDTGESKGIDWANGLTFTGTGGSWRSAFPYSVNASDDSIFDYGELGPWGPAWTPSDDEGALKNEDDNIDDTGAYDAPDVQYGNISMATLTATLQLVHDDNTIDLIQAPEIVALDNEEATIHIARTIRYASATVENNNGVTTTTYQEAGQVTDGVQLLVIPQVVPDVDRIIMTVIPKTEEFERFDDYGGQGGTPALRLPRTAEKLVVTRMMLENRETGVIGGLMNEEDNFAFRKVPFLGDLPVVGWLFKRETKNKVKQNVIILITPTIIKPGHGEEFDNELRRVREDIAMNNLIGE